jgi:hypothetical protein
MSGNRDSSVGMATGNELDSGAVQIAEMLRLLPSPLGQDLPQGLPSRLSKGYRRVKWSGREADHSPPTSVQAKNNCVHISTPPTASVV